MAKLKTKRRECPKCHGAGKVHEATGAALREFREDAGVSLGEVARGMGVSTPYLSDVELGKRRVTERVIAEYRKLEGKR